MKTYLLKKTNKIISVTLVLIGDTLSLLREISVWLMGISKNRLFMPLSSRSGNGFSFSHKRDCRIT